MPAASFGNITFRLEDHLIPNPIRKVLSTMAARQVRALLMGGQACVFYGAAEFSRGVDLAVLAESGNPRRLEAALQELHAGPEDVRRRTTENKEKQKRES